MEIIKKNKKLFLKTILFISLLLFGFVFALSNIANDNVNRQEHRKVISEEIQKNRHEAWQGTAIPNDGTRFQNIYFNINLKTDAVISLLKNIEFNLLNNEEIYIVVYESTNDTRVSVIKNEENYIIKLSNIFDSEGTILFNNGWTDNARESIPFTNRTLSEYESIPVGNQNEALSSLFSTTPFVEEKKSVIEIIGNGIADAAIKFGDVITFGFESIKNVIFNEDNTLTYTGSVVVVLVSTAIISFAFRLLLKVFGSIRVG